MAQPKENLEVWRVAMDMTISVYRLTQSFPASEIYGLTSQLRRASVSVASNVAEGRGRLSDLDFRRFLGMAQGSNFEVQTQLIVARELNYGDPQKLADTLKLSQSVGRMLSSLLLRISAQPSAPVLPKANSQKPKADNQEEQCQQSHI